uniref:FHA domain-containing protein n=1 Tax=Mesocestoides corti TaxID=53468 RepID=A0A5K3FQ32_MESCO
MGGGIVGSRKVQSRSKLRNREASGAYDRRKQLDPPWRPEDDYLLIHSVFVTCNLAEVHSCVRFTKPFSESDIEQRWRLLLFNPVVSSTSREAIARMPQVVRYSLDAKIPFNGDEDALLMTVSYNDVYREGFDKYTVFYNLLHEHPHVFYTTRSPFHLYAQWNRLRSCQLVSDEGIKKVSEAGGDPESFSDTEFIIQETTARVLQAGLPHLMEPSNIARRKRLLGSADTYHGFQASVSQTVADSLVKRQRSSSFCVAPTLGGSSGGTNRLLSRSPSLTGMKSDPAGTDQSDSSNSGTEEAASQAQWERYRARKRLHSRLARVEEEARRWTALVESKVASGTIISDRQPVYPTLATLTGRRSRFLIKCRNVTFGRAVRDFTPDIDLSCEGVASRISRRHGKIALSDTGVFWLTNFSKHPVIVDGVPVLKDKEYRLTDKSIVCISHLSLRFDVEHAHLSLVSGLQNPCGVDSMPFLPTDACFQGERDMRNQQDEFEQTPFKNL